MKNLQKVIQEKEDTLQKNEQTIKSLKVYIKSYVFSTQEQIKTQQKQIESQSREIASQTQKQFALSKQIEKIKDFKSNFDLPIAHNESLSEETKEILLIQNQSLKEKYSKLKEEHSLKT